MSDSGQQYELIFHEKAVQDLIRIGRDRNNPFLRRQALQELNALATGTSNGHHALGYEPGKGDLRDTVASRLQSDPQGKPDFRLAFREMPPACPGGLPRREILAVKPRHGSNGIYPNVAFRLERHPDDQQPGLQVFGNRPAGSGKNQAERRAELDGMRAVALAYAGQQPHRSSRPLDLSALSPRTGVTAPTTRPRGTEKA